MDMSRIATEALQALSNRFGGVDLQYRRTGWDSHSGDNPNKFRARLLPETNEDEAYRLVAYGYTALEAVAALTGMVTAVDRYKMETRKQMDRVYVLDGETIRPATPDDLQ